MCSSDLIGDIEYWMVKKVFPSGNLQPMDVKKIKYYDKIVPIFTTGKLKPDSVIAQGTAPSTVGFVEGQDVKAGQVLARIDPRTFQATLQQAQATKARDEALLANARLDLQRFEDLIRTDSTTRQTVDTQRALVNQLAATVRNDEAQIALARVQLDFTTITAPLSGRVGARLVDPGNIIHATDTTGLVVIRQIDPIDVVFTLQIGRAHV